MRAANQAVYKNNTFGLGNHYNESDRIQKTKMSNDPYHIRTNPNVPQQIQQVNPLMERVQLLDEKRKELYFQNE